MRSALLYAAVLSVLGVRAAAGEAESAVPAPGVKPVALKIGEVQCDYYGVTLFAEVTAVIEVDEPRVRARNVGAFFVNGKMGEPFLARLRPAGSAYLLDLKQDVPLPAEQSRARVQFFLNGAAASGVSETTYDPGLCNDARARFERVRRMQDEDDRRRRQEEERDRRRLFIFPGGQR